jgi:TPR repeat protein
MIKKNINLRLLLFACGIFSGFLPSSEVQAGNFFQRSPLKEIEIQLFKGNRGLQLENETQRRSHKVKGHTYHLNQKLNDLEQPHFVSDKVIDKYNQAVQYENKRDFKKAFESFKFAAEGNHPKALFSLANYYELGIGTKKNLKKAADCLQKVLQLEQDNLEASYRLGCYYEKGGEGLEKNTALAISYYVAAYEGGYELAGKKLKQIDVEKWLDNTNKKEYILAKIIQTDNPNYKFQYANLIKNQEKFSDKYLFYLKEAANQKHSDAILSLGNYYYQNHMLAELRSLFTQYEGQKEITDEQWSKQMEILQHSAQALAYEQSENRDLDKALWHWKKAAELGSQQAEERVQALTEEMMPLAAPLSRDTNRTKSTARFATDKKNISQIDYFKKGELLFDKNQNKENNQQAYLYYQKVSPTQNPLVLKRLGELHFYQLIPQASDKEAIRFFEAYLERQPQDGETHYLLGLIYQNQAYNERAKTHFEKAKSLGFQVAQH